MRHDEGQIFEAFAGWQMVAILTRGARIHNTVDVQKYNVATHGTRSGVWRRQSAHISHERPQKRPHNIAGNEPARERAVKTLQNRRSGGPTLNTLAKHPKATAEQTKPQPRANTVYEDFETCLVSVRSAKASSSWCEYEDFEDFEYIIGYENEVEAAFMIMIMSTVQIQMQTKHLGARAGVQQRGGAVRERVLGLGGRRRAGAACGARETE